MADTPQLPELPSLSDILPSPTEVAASLVTKTISDTLSAFLLAPINTLKETIETGLKNLLATLPKTGK